MREFFQHNKVLLAPMAGVSDVAMRTLSREFGADMTYTEMVSAKGLSYANEKTRQLLELAEGEDRVAVQLFGHEPDVMASQAAWIEEVMGPHLAWLDINMGCPVRKITSKGEGSALMQTPELAADIARCVKNAVQFPVTVKFRRGFAMGEETAPEFAKRMEQAGVDAIAVHGRFAQQMYGGKSDRGTIARVKEAVSIPVVGNGDIRHGSEALTMMEETGCDAVMIGRGAQGNPWIFAEAKAAVAGEAVPPRPSVYEKVEVARRHAKLLSEREGRNIVRMRKHASWYTTGVPRGSEARGRINDCVTFEDFEAVFDDILRVTREFEEAGFYMNNTGL